MIKIAIYTINKLVVHVAMVINRKELNKCHIAILTFM